MMIILNLLLKLVLFVILNIAFFVIPGWYFIRLAGFKESFFEKIIFGEIVGIVFFSLSVLVLKIFNLSLFFYFPIVIIFLIKAKFGLDLKRAKPFFKKNIFVLLFIFLSSVLQNLPLFLSGIQSKTEGLIFTSDWAFRDFSWHWALAGELKKGVLPTNPVFKGKPLKGYHFLFDLLLSGFQQLSGISFLDLLYRFFPFLISILFGSVIFLFVRKFFEKKTALLTVFLSYLGGSFAYLAPLISSQVQDWGESTFWVSQTFSMATQPHFLFSIIFLLAGLMLLENKKNKKTCVISAFLFSSAVIFKAYALFVVVPGLMITGTYKFLKNKKTDYLFTTGLTLLLILFAFLPLNSGGKNFFWSPLWFPTKMVENPDRLNKIDWILKEQHYRLTNNFLRLWQLKIYELIIFIIGNLGIRVLGLLGIYLALRKKVKKSFIVFLISGIVVVFVFPLLFLQTGTVWNSIQTWYYLLVLLNIFTGFFLSFLIDKNKNLIIIVVVLLILLSLPTTIKFFININKADKLVVSEQKIQLLQMLKKRTAEKSVIVFYPSEWVNSSSIVSALSERRAFLAHCNQIDLFGYNFDQQRKELIDLLASTNKDTIKNFLEENNVDYLVFEDIQKKNISSQFLSFFQKEFKQEGFHVYKNKR